MDLKHFQSQASTSLVVFRSSIRHIKVFFCCINHDWRTPGVFLAEIHRHRGASQVGEVEITARIEALQRKLNKLNSMETDLVGLKLRGQVSQEVFEQQGALLKAERVHYQEETARQEQALQGHRERNEALGLSTGVESIPASPRAAEATPSDIA